MTDEWFNEYMFRLVLETKYVPKKVLDIFKQKPVRLPAWDPMFAPEEWQMFYEIIAGNKLETYAGGNSFVAFVEEKQIPFG